MDCEHNTTPAGSRRTERIYLDVGLTTRDAPGLRDCIRIPSFIDAQYSILNVQQLVNR